MDLGPPFFFIVKIQLKNNSDFINLGIFTGHSVFDIKYEILEKEKGDPLKLLAEILKAKEF